MQSTEQVSPQRSSTYPLRVVLISIPLHSIASVDAQELELPLLWSDLTKEQQENLLTELAFRATGVPAFAQSASSRPTATLADGRAALQIPPIDRRVISSSVSNSTFNYSPIDIIPPELIKGQSRRLPVVIIQTKVMKESIALLLLFIRIYNCFIVSI